MRGRPARTYRSEGRLLSLVPLGRSRAEAVIETDDYQTLLRNGISANFCTQNGTVVAHGPGRKKYGIARLLLGARQGERVAYRDGNPLNLRRSNLRLTMGWGVRNDAKELVAAQEAQAA